MVIDLLRFLFLISLSGNHLAARYGEQRTPRGFGFVAATRPRVQIG